MCPVVHSFSQLVQEMINSEKEYVKDVEFVSSHHLKQMEREDVPPETASQKEAIFRNIDDIKAFHSRLLDMHYILHHREDYN